jgi:hypothetical protein
MDLLGTVLNDGQWKQISDYHNQWKCFCQLEKFIKKVDAFPRQSFRGGFVLKYFEENGWTNHLVVLKKI